MELIEDIMVNYPKDWKELNLGKSSILKARIGWQGLTTAEYLDNGEYFLITGTDFKNGFIDWDNCVFVEKERYDQDKYIQIVENDVLVTKDGTIGKVALVKDVPKPTTLNSGVFVIRPVGDSYYPQYFYYILMSEHFRDFLGKLSAGSTISHLYQKDFIHYNFPAPPTIKEQKSIAAALTDVDELISGLEKLISKKKDIKQGTMQQLLTPPHKAGKRLPGFLGEWVETNFGKYIFLQGGYAFSSSTFKKDGVPILRISNIQAGFIDLNDVVFSYDNSITKQFIAHTGDVLIAMSGATTGKIGVYQHLRPAYVNQRVGKFTIIENKADLNFIRHITQSFRFESELTKQIAQGAQPNISGKQIESFVLDFPDDIEEQQAIAQILSDMDAEITQLETKKEKYNSIKQGMMQELLTGKTRLV